MLISILNFIEYIESEYKVKIYNWNFAYSNKMTLHNKLNEKTIFKCILMQWELVKLWEKKTFH